MTDDDFESRYAELQAQYVDRTRERIAELESLLERADGKLDGEAIDAIYQIVHRLSGSGETMGFDEISRLSIALEEELESERTAELEERVRDYCRRIRACLAT